MPKKKGRFSQLISSTKSRKPKEFSEQDKLELYMESTQHLAGVLVDFSDKKEELNCDDDTYQLICRGLSYMIRDSEEKYKGHKYMPENYDDVYSHVTELFNHGPFYPPEDRTDAQKEFIDESINGLKQKMDKYTDNGQSLSHLPSDHKEPGTKNGLKRSGV